MKIIHILKHNLICINECFIFNIQAKMSFAFRLVHTLLLFIAMFVKPLVCINRKQFPFPLSVCGPRDKNSGKDMCPSPPACCIIEVLFWFAISRHFRKQFLLIYTKNNFCYFLKSKFKLLIFQKKSCLL